MKEIFLTAAMLAFISTAQAQGYVLQTPGHPPAYAIPRGNGTYVISGTKAHLHNPTGRRPLCCSITRASARLRNPTRQWHVCYSGTKAHLSYAPMMCDK